jgi:hypothetical protein
MQDRAVSADRLWLAGAPQAPPEDPIYNGCGTTKLCFGIPNDCALTRNCNMLATVYDNNGNFEFELLGAGELIADRYVLIVIIIIFYINSNSQLHRLWIVTNSINGRFKCYRMCSTNSRICPGFRFME